LFDKNFNILLDDKLLLFFFDKNFYINLFFNNFFILNIKIFIVFIFFFIFFIIHYFFNKFKNFIIFILFFFIPIIISNLIIISTFNFFLIYLLLELQFFCFIGLFFTNYKKISKEFYSIILNFFFLNCIASLFILFSLLLFYSCFLSLNFNSIFIFLITYPNYLPFYFKKILYMSIVFFSIGFSFKFGFFPFNYWLASIYKKLPIYIIILYSSVSKFGFFYLFFIYYFLLNSFLNFILFYIFFLLCIFTIFSSIILGLFEFNLKSLIGYSSINFFSSVFIVFLQGTETLVYISIYFFCFYILLNLFILLLIIKFENLLNKNLYINDLIILIKINPFLVYFFIFLFYNFLIFIFFFFFFFKFLNFYSLVFIFSFFNYINLFFLILFLILNIISLFYYLRLFKICLFDINFNYNFKNLFVYYNKTYSLVFYYFYFFLLIFLIFYPFFL